MSRFGQTSLTLKERELVKPHQVNAFVNTYMKLADAGETDEIIAGKISRGYGQKRFSPRDMNAFIKGLHSRRMGGANFLAWMDVRQGNPEKAHQIASVIQMPHVPGDEKNGMLRQINELRASNLALTKDLAQAREFAEDAKRRPLKEVVDLRDKLRTMQIELNTAITRRSDAEYALENALRREEAATKRADAAESASVSAARSADAEKVDREESTRLRTLLTKRENRLTEVEKELEARDLSLKRQMSATQKAQAEVDELKARAKATIPRERDSRPRIAEKQRHEPADIGEALETLVSAGAMTHQEAFRKLKDAGR